MVTLSICGEVGSIDGSYLSDYDHLQRIHQEQTGSNSTRDTHSLPRELLLVTYHVSDVKAESRTK